MSFNLAVDLIAQVEGLTGWEQFGAWGFGLAILLAVISLLLKDRAEIRRNLEAERVQLRKDLEDERAERKTLDKLVLEQVVPLVTKATETMRQMSEQMTANQRLNAEQQRVLDRVVAKVDRLDHE